MKPEVLIIDKSNVECVMGIENLIVVTPYFNPCGYKMRRVNYDIFIKGITDAGVRCVTIEWALEDCPFELAPSPEVIHIRGGALLWQKERMINLAVATLPKECKYVAWLDADILFNNVNWASETIEVMKEFKIAQMFEVAEQLPKNDSNENSEFVDSFAAVSRTARGTLFRDIYRYHGHTGYGWVAHREVFNLIGLYEHAIVGSADHFMTHAIFNEYPKCMSAEINPDGILARHLREWGTRFSVVVGGRVGVVSGRIKHLWHGTEENRQYGKRTLYAESVGYNPYTDLKFEEGKLTQWADNLNMPKLENLFRDYFEGRLEDN